MRDPYLAARVDDIRVVGKRLIRNLTQEAVRRLFRLPEGAIVLAEELTPADTALMDPQRIAGFATRFGGADSHTAIIARALGLPAVLGVPGLLEHARPERLWSSTAARAPSSSTRRPRRSRDYDARRDALTRERRYLRGCAGCRR